MSPKTFSRALRVPTALDAFLYLGPLAFLWIMSFQVLYATSPVYTRENPLNIVLRAVRSSFFDFFIFLGKHMRTVGLVCLIWTYFANRANRIIDAVTKDIVSFTTRKRNGRFKSSDAGLRRHFNKSRKRHLSNDSMATYADFVPKRVRAHLGELLNVAWIPPDQFGVPEVFTHMTLHPLDRLARFVLSRVVSAEEMFRVLQWRRVNPTLNMRAKHLAKYNRPLAPVTTAGMILFNQRLRTLVDEAELASDDFLDTLADSLTDMTDYSTIGYKGSSAAGWPFKPGMTKNDVFDDAVHYATREYADDLPTLNSHIWYTGGRGKLVHEDEPDSSRMVSYAGFPYLLIVNKYSQPFNAQFNAKRDMHNSSIGMSWFHGGAKSFKDWFTSRLFGAPSHYASLDVSGWDTSIQTPLLESVRDFHIANIRRAGGRRGFSVAAANTYAHRFGRIYNDMINAKLLLPQRLLFQCTRGMKSGFALTATDNTIIHMCVFHAVLNTVEPRYAQRVIYKVYGDDNFFAVPDDVLMYFDIESIKNAYSSLFGFIIRPGPTSGAYYPNFGGPDYLSKHVRTTADGTVYAWRPAEDTYRRLVHPDCFTVPPGKEATLCRLVGHYIDNYSNVSVRTTLKPCIDALASELDVIDLDISSTDLDKLCWTLSQAQAFLGGKVHLPDLDAICLDLYGAVITHSRYDYHHLNDLVLRNDEFNPHHEAADAFLGDAVGRVVKETTDALALVHPYSTRSTAWRKIRIYRSLLPFSGIGGWRVVEALRRLATRGHLSAVRHMLDVGAHPGSSTCALMSRYPRATIRVLSKHPFADSGGPFCPKLPSRLGVLGLEPIAWDEGKSVALSESPDLINIDILSVDEAESDASHNSTVLDIIDDIDPGPRPVRIILARFKTLDDETCVRLHKYYTRASAFVAFRCRYDKPFSRNIVVAMHFPPGGCGPRLPLRRGRFVRAFNAFRNSLADISLKSVDMYKAAIEDSSSITPNPAQFDDDLQARLRRT